MKDIQSQNDSRKIPIDKVGIEDLIYPIRVMDRANVLQHTIAKVKLSVELPHNFRGTHMSRFVEVLNKHSNNITLHNIEDILDELKKVLKAEKSYLEFEFPYFMKKKAPVSGMESYMNYLCRFIASKGEKFDFIVEVNVPVHTLCPCSKEIADRGAHNQRAEIQIQVRTLKLVWIGELVELAEESASGPLFALLKRSDEKLITEKAFDTPRFVEDVVREVAIKLYNEPRVYWFKINVKSFESIHNHNAFASVEIDKRQ
ncbi:MAG: GTP cyclohydrolase FolE2 [Candidatus Hydrothermia bacterium]|nr:GTP cyclohydrolase FolE2 [Candidatus Hydrothermia bacterium]